VISGEILVRSEIPLEPLPMPRPRSQARGGRPYTPAKFRDYLERVSFWLLMTRATSAPVAGPIGLRLEFDRSTRRRCDLDNLVKGVWDAGTGVLWVDDSQIEYLEAVKRIGPAGRISVLAVLLDEHIASGTKV